MQNENFCMTSYSHSVIKSRYVVCKLYFHVALHAFMQFLPKFKCKPMNILNISSTMPIYRFAHNLHLLTHIRFVLTEISFLGCYKPNINVAKCFNAYYICIIHLYIDLKQHKFSLRSISFN